MGIHVSVAHERLPVVDPETGERSDVVFVVGTATDGKMHYAYRIEPVRADVSVEALDALDLLAERGARFGLLDSLTTGDSLR